MTEGEVLEVEALRARNAALAQQLKRLVQTEQRLNMSQRDLALQVRRVDALNQFAMRAVVTEEAPAILDSAMHLLFSLFPFEQGLAFVSDAEGALSPVAARAVPGREAASPEGLERQRAAGPLRVAVPEEAVGAHPAELRASGDAEAALLDALAAVFGESRGAPGPGREFALILPVPGPSGPRRSVVVLRRPPVALNFHDQLPTPGDRSFLNLVGQTVGAALTNAHLVASLKRSVGDLERAQRDLVAQERLAAIGELAAVVAHEVRNPLGAIFNSLANLERLVNPAGDVGPLLDIVREEASRVNRTVADLLEFARPPVLAKYDHALSGIAEDAVASARADARARGVALRLVVNGDARAWVDEHLLRRALLNLIDNATQASSEGDVVEVRVRRVEEHALIEVEDFGPGISDETLDQIFEPFFTTKSIGTGLGLAVVKRFTDSHGGEVLIRSSPSAGSVFTIRLTAR